MFIVGLTGGLASGKSTVLKMIRENGIAVIDADVVAREVLEPGSAAWHEVREFFGDEILNNDGTVNRVKLGDDIFDDLARRRILNAITHPKIKRAMIKKAIALFFSGHKFIVMEVPLLFETGNMLGFMKKIITVSCEDHQQLLRLCRRNEISVVVAKKRISTQMPLAEKMARSHYVIDNSGDLENTRHQTECVLRVIGRSKFTFYFRSIVLITALAIGFAVGHQINNVYNNTE